MAVTKAVINACVAYAAQFGMPTHVYYPACGNDASPSVAFPEAKITYLDIDAGGLLQIKNAYPDAMVVHRPAETMPSGGIYDLTIDIHSHAPFEAETRHMMPGNHLLIANK